MFACGFAWPSFEGLQLGRASLNAAQARLRAARLPAADAGDAGNGQPPEGSPEPARAPAVAGQQEAGAPPLAFEGGTLPARAAAETAALLDPSLVRQPHGAARHPPKSKTALISRRAAQSVAVRLDPLAAVAAHAAAGTAALRPSLRTATCRQATSFLDRRAAVDGVCRGGTPLRMLGCLVLLDEPFLVSPGPTSEVRRCRTTTRAPRVPQSARSVQRACAGSDTKTAQCQRSQ
jgi:hypothetical protein